MANVCDQVQEINQKLEQLTKEQLKTFIANFLIQYKSEVEALQEEALNLLEKCELCGAMPIEYEFLWQVLREIR
jgi:ABC-type Zn uptake system ZnuABC Zn-binding protein ZnuA